MFPPGKKSLLSGIVISTWAFAFCALLIGERPAFGASAAGISDASLAEALNLQTVRADFKLKTKAWIFPESRYGPVKIVFAVQFDQDLAGGKLAARITEDNGDDDQSLPTWESSIGDGDRSGWIRTTRLPAGSYTMAVAAVTKDHQHIGNTFYKFQINGSVARKELEGSSLLLATDCRQEDRASGERQDLFNPLEEDGCVLAPGIMPVAQKDKPLHILFRLYADNTVSYKQFPDAWHAWVEFRDATDTTWIRKSVPFTFCAPRGWGVRATISPKELNLKPGLYRVSVIVAGPGAENQHYSAVDFFRYSGEGL